MCGVCGFATSRPLGRMDGKQVVERMADTLRHRGPDAGSTWQDEDAGIFLGHRRLAIIELSRAGDQPMVAQSGRWVLSFNGEIYNHLALRRALPDRLWRGASDTETLLAGFDVWGLKATIQRAVGMFALAVWDRETRQLTLARDRFGEKPLYYGWQGTTLVFGSELKALRQHPEFLSELDTDGLALFLRWGHVPAPHSAYRGIVKLLPGTTATFSGAWVPGEMPEPVPYWSLYESARQGLANPFTGTMDDAADELERRLTRALSRQMLADVPVGAFLSGGIDSSLVVALMQRHANRPVHTFCLGFEEVQYDEARYASPIARHLGTTHNELYVSERDALGVVPTIVEMFDEPFGDSSSIPTSLLCALTRRHVTVALSGDGGDEMFVGYTRYSRSARIIDALGRWPQMTAASAPFLGTGVRAIATAMRKMPASWRPARWLNKAERVAALAGTPTATDRYGTLVAHSVADGDNPARRISRRTGEWEAWPGFRERDLATLDLATSFADDILVKVDRASMASSLETRAPLLDPEVAELALSLPRGLLIDETGGKAVMRHLLARHIPRSLTDRPKQGFAAPIATWLKGGLHEWARELVTASTHVTPRVVNPVVLERRFSEFLAGSGEWQNEIWDMLMLLAWQTGSAGRISARDAPSS